MLYVYCITINVKKKIVFYFVLFQMVKNFFGLKRYDSYFKLSAVYSECMKAIDSACERRLLFKKFTIGKF